MSHPVKIRRALLSVSDKTDLIPFARSLEALGVQIVSTGGTARSLAEAGIRVMPIEQVTGFPEIMDGRVKTLHPSVHGAILARRDNAEHVAAMNTHGIEAIDLVCINLYPFEKTVSQPGVSLEDAIENIDVGGPAMMRAAAKNFHWVTICSSPKRYDQIVNELTASDGCTSLELRAELAAAAFGHTAEYDAAIASFLSRRSPQAFPQVLRLSYTRVDELRYGENPHQSAALYRDPASTGPTIVNSQQLHGKQLSFNNINDAAAALEVVKALRGLVSANINSICTATFGQGAGGNESGSRHSLLLPDHVGACVVKHTNPCGAAVAPSVVAAIDAAIAGDPQAAYGGILAVNSDIDAAAARRIAVDETFFEVVIAPGYSDEALDILRKRWAHVRLLAVGSRASSRARKLDYRSVPGGMLVQDRDSRQSTPEQWEHRAGPAPSPTQAAAAAFLETACKYVASNSIVIGGAVTVSSSEHSSPPIRLFGIGSGQVDRVTACRNAVAKAGDLCAGAIAVGDAFFPFSDGPRVLAEAGVKVIVHPGGSKRDQDTFDLCNEMGITCLTTGVRHFRH
ncbi:MAG: bifunctional phosphoribosylaminoimidazolecarboxamide formyltransferase/IMP cyclohydrolase [Pyrinomonadaceae bacterium]|nr:bifunctional phosphoribosylaminoimidazolecarboxamide formyltransferase/IMP cyclohydrolase [Phycisphaerales bacterium]